MKMKQKLVKVIFTIVISLLVVWEYQTPAVIADSQGKLEMKIDRITEEKSENTSKKETEIEKIFPMLFAEETATTVEEKKAQQEQSLDKLEEVLFTINAEPNKTLQQTKDALFTKDYETIAATTTKQTDDQSEDKEASESDNTMLYALAGFALLLCGGLYVMMQKMLN